MKATLNDQLEQTFRLRALTLMVGLALIAMSNQESLARSNETSAAFTATQLVRQFTLKNTVAQVNQGMQGYVAEVNGQLRSEGMGPTPTSYPVGMGSVPVTVNLPQRDGAGRPLGYCAWDNSSNTSNASFLAGLGVASPLLYAVISPGLNGAIETTCAQILVSGVGNNDDYVLTTAPTQASSRQFRSSVGTEAELFAMAGENGDVRLVTETNRLYSHLNGTWTAIGAASNFADDSAANGAGAISYTAGKVTVGDFQAGSAVITGALTAGSLLGNGSGLTDLNMSNAGSGVLSAAFGGTGVDSSAAANGQLLIGNGSGFVLGGLTAGAGIGVATGAGTITISNTGVTSIAGTLDQVIVSGTTGDITLSLPQAIGVTSSPTFGGMSLNGALAGTDASFTGAVNVGTLSVAGVPATLAFTYANSTGDPVYLDNLALGAGALAGEKRGSNVALGQLAMSSMVASANTTHGVRNTALGSVAMFRNQTGRDNVAVGEAALFGNINGDFNTAVGRAAMYSNTSGASNAAFGNGALFSNTTGQLNTAIGQSALYNSTGSNNVALGQSTLSALTSGQYSTGLGQGADVTSGGLNYATAIGASSRVSTADTLVLGALAANKNSAVSTTDDQVVIGATGRNDTQLNTKLFVNGAVNIADKLFVNGVEVIAGAGTNASNINSGLLATTYGGTGVNGSAAANGQLLIGNGTGYTLANITGTANQINVVNGAGSIALSLPQNIATTSTPTFGGMILNGGLSGTTGMFTGAVTASRLNVGTLEGVVNTNTIIGLNAIEGVQSGFGSNVAVGQSAMRYNTTGAYNVGVGLNALLSNTTGNFNSALGEAALSSNTTGSSNVAIGQAAMFANTTGYGNTAVGVRSLQANTTGYSNAALGERSLQANTTGVFNTALGDYSLADNISGGRNTAVGNSALGRNTTGLHNTALGLRAGHSNFSGDNTNANITGSYNTFLGAYAMPGTTVQLQYATAIGAEALVTSSNTLVLGRATTDQVVIGATGRNDTKLNTKLFVNGAVNIADKLFVNGVEVVAGAGTNASNINSGLLATTYGGTGVNGSAAANGQLLIGNGTGYTLANITGTANQINVVNGAGSIALSLPQNIATTSTPTFAGLTLTGALTGTTGAFTGSLSAQRLVLADSTGGVTNPNLVVGSGAMLGTAGGLGGSTAVGVNALQTNTSGAQSFIGSYNAALGLNALRDNADGSRNVAVGADAAARLVGGFANVALGYRALNTTTPNIYESVAIGHRTMEQPTGGENVGIGASAMEQGGGTQNVAVGAYSMYGVDGARNAGVGYLALYYAGAGYNNAALGAGALEFTEGGYNNSGVGNLALRTNSGGFNNSALGAEADVTSANLSFATAIGSNAKVATSNTLALGRNSAVDQVVIGTDTRNDTRLNTRLYVNGAVNIADKLFVNGVEITGSGSTNASDINSGLLATTYGGTGVNGSAAANGQLLIGNGSGYTLGNITGTANQVTVTNGAGTITLGLPQDIATTSTPTFGGLTLNGTLAGTTANFSGRLDAATLFIGGVEVLPVTKASVDAALTFSSDTGDINFNQPNLSLGAGALSASNRAANVAIGASVLGMLTADPDGSKGVDNTGVGYRALFSASTGYRNTALGARAAHNLTTGYANTTIGRGAGYGITAGYENTVIGENALFNGAASYQNIAIGNNAMQAANTAYNNIALGNNSLLVVTSGYENTGIGRSAMNSTTSGFRNIGIGMEALRSNTTGNYNMGIGYRADVTSGNLVYAQAIGNMAQVATSNTLVLGGLGANKFGSTTDDQVVIGATSRNDAEANTVLYVNGTTHINGKLYTTDSHITARMQINTGLPNGLHFGGNTENLDTTSIYRFNQASDQTYLRVRLSDNNQGFGTSFSDEFQIGYQDSSYTATFRVAGSGAVISSSSITATAFNTSSDRRLKNNLQMQDADALLNKLSSLSAYSYDYVGQRDLGRRIGVIAQDMLPLFPEAVNVRPDGFYAVDYGALGALAAAGVGRLNDRVVELDKAFKESGAAQTVARIDTLEGTVTEHGQRIGALESWKLSAEMQLTKTDERLGTLETWRTAATEKMDTMQNAIDLNIQKIADHAIAIQANTVAIERLDDALFTLDGRVKNNSDLINNINARWAQNFNASEDGSVLTVNAVELKVSNFTAQNMRASTVYSQRLEAEMARIVELEVNNLRANSAVANTVQAEQVNTGSAQVYAGVGMPAVLFSAKSDGHYTVNTSALDGSYATATVIVNAGQAKVIGGQNEGIELYAEGNTIKALAAGKSIKASWIKTG